MRRLPVLSFLLVLFCEQTSAQEVHILLFDTEGVELANSGFVSGIQEYWYGLRDEIDPVRDAVCFFGEFGDVGDFGSTEIRRFGTEALNNLFGSDSLISPVVGTSPAEDTWKENLANMAGQLPQKGTSYSVTLISLNGQGEDADLRRMILQKLAVILNRTNRSGARMKEDSWMFFDPITKQVDDVWK